MPRHQAAAEPEPCGDLRELDTSRLLLDAVGNELFAEVVNNDLDLSGTSSAVCERAGGYDHGIFVSGWCRFLDAASRERRRTVDTRAALASVWWLCHESCWTWQSKPSIETGGPTDVGRTERLRIRTAPIVAQGEVVGAINFGNGTPPREPAALRELVDRYGVATAALERPTREYAPQPEFGVA